MAFFPSPLTISPFASRLTRLRGHVRGRVDRLGQRGDSDGEPLLDLVEHLLVAVRRDKADGETLGSESTGSANSVEVAVGVRRGVLGLAWLSTPTEQFALT